MKNILVIEEDRNFSHLLCQFLRNHNFHVIEAVNPSIGFSLVEDQYPDLVICSFESLAFNENKCRRTSQEIRDTLSRVQIPWILLTTKTSILSIFSNLLLSEIAILKKPVKFDLILLTIRSELNQFSTYSSFSTTRSILNHQNPQYCYSKLESLLNYGRRSTRAKLRSRSKTSRIFPFLNIRCNLQIEVLENNLKIKLCRRSIV